MCAGALVMSQLDRCVFGAYDGKRGCCGSVYDLPGDPALMGRTRWQAGVMAEECRELLDACFAGLRAHGEAPDQPDTKNTTDAQDTREGK